MKHEMIEMFHNADSLADAAAAGVAGALGAGLRRRGRSTLAATGGRSPGPVYDRLAATALDWSRVVVTLTDERCVPAADPESNEGLLRGRLLGGKAAKAGFLPLWPAPKEAAIRALLPFDAVMLGMGEDGHVASLIPGSPTLAQGLAPGGPLTVLTPAGLGSPPLARISLTIAALLQARIIFLLIAGPAKRDVLERALAGEDLPVAALLRQDRAPVRVLWSPDP